ncbi:hypothetical protein AGRA3207_003746 [Actinomadura graeca]|uniref:BP74 N-terminal domain-containing protein n=1 Tax=Actinomadura graeca TaxID=2750812 RepID=A0ABX8QVQ5_9ACTN|nr:hypothetical protein [Actinomadura graeca]QXJ22698.1 hypothetical protein AGRA3207_003746 [Actinomadura graeca]
MRVRTFIMAGAVAAGLIGSAVAADADTGPAREATQYVAEFEVSGEHYKVRLTDQKDIDDARALLDSDNPGSLTPNGKFLWGVVDVNAPYNWSIDPDVFSFTDAAPEGCDGRPSWVDGPDWGHGGWFCPWDAVILSLDPITN